ncbi:recombination protein RecT [Dietzia aurantiaca]|uniref:recombination protein RecT n=1 Tax=Dietzia aurantiaca TaxID=983873 RepID=UPI001E2E664E|nr:recombination protein RecT [Dietzia aurantiaca]MCD2263265.1 recombination protein RecT [Dietzia aurantiaca]
MARDLAQRATNGAARNGGGAPATLSDQIRNMQDQFQLAMPRGAEASQLVRDALTCVRQTPQLADCDPATVFGALMTCAQLGLRPGVLGHAWLLPFRNKGQLQAQLVVGYQGMVELAHRSGQIKSLIARTVYANDTFDVDYGLEDRLVHKPTMRGPKGEAIAYYAIAKFNSGGHAFYVMGHDEMLEYKDKNTRAKFGPWVDHFEQMAHKTCVRQLAKWMPKSTDMAVAVDADEKIRIDTSPDAITSGQYVNTPQIEAAPVEGQAGPDLSDAVEMVTDAQLKKMHAQLSEIGVTDDEGRHRELSQIVGRQIVSARDLSIDEASVVIEALTAATSEGGGQ